MKKEEIVLGLLLLCAGCYDGPPGNYSARISDYADSAGGHRAVLRDSLPAASDTVGYRRKWLQLVHGKPSAQWPVNTVLPLPGAVLPYRRVVAFYGNFYSPGMGILGQLPSDELLARLKEVAADWILADTATPVQPAIHYIAVTAQASAGRDGKYRLRMPFNQIDKAVGLAAEINGLVFLDVQVGHSTVQAELPLLSDYLRRPQVHLGIDPEYSMKGGEVPCSVIGTLDAADVNFAIDYLTELVQQYHLPPKILVIHRFTKAMLTNYRDIRITPEVQLVINMDGFGFPAKKIDSYKDWVAGEPVQFTGFKLFYKQDLLDKRGARLMTPEEVLRLYPQPIYIQYQ